jgi:hypothetical protein
MTAYCMYFQADGKIKGREDFEADDDLAAQCSGPFSMGAINWSPGAGSAGGFDAFHVVVAEAEVVADLVDEHVAYHIRQVLAGYRRVVEDRSTIERDDIGIRRRIGGAAARAGNTMVEAEEMIGAPEAETRAGLFVGKLLDPDQDAIKMSPEGRRNCGERTVREPLDIGT